MDFQQVSIINLTEKELQDVIYKAVLYAFQQSSVLTLGLGDNKATWLTRMQAAQYLNVSLPTLDKLAKTGKIGVHRLGRKKMYSREDMDKSIQIQKIKFK